MLSGFCLIITQDKSSVSGPKIVFGFGCPFCTMLL